MEKNTIKLGKTMYWPIVAKHYTDVFLKIVTLNKEEIGVV